MDLAHQQSRIDDHVARGAAFYAIEDEIDTIDASEHEKSALWLYAFALQDKTRQLQITLAALADLTGRLTDEPAAV